MTMIFLLSWNIRKYRTTVKWQWRLVGTRIWSTSRDTVRAWHKKTTDPVWLPRKCSTVKSSGELSSIPILRPSPPFIPSLLQSTFKLNYRDTSKKGLRPLRIRESLNSHRPWYISRLPPWFVKNYPLCLASLNSLLATDPSYPHLNVHLRSGLPFSLRLLPLGDSHPLPSRGKISASRSGG